MNSDCFKTCMKFHLLNIYNQISFYQYSVYVSLSVVPGNWDFLDCSSCYFGLYFVNSGAQVIHNFTYSNILITNPNLNINHKPNST